MKRKIIITILVAISLLSVLIFFERNPYHHGLIIESDQLATVLDHINTPNTIVIFDIDNTLAHSPQELGSDEWFSYLVNKKIAAGNNARIALHDALPILYDVEFNIDLEPTEPEIPALFQELINAGVPVMALTNRNSFMADRTIEQLDAINIMFFMPEITPEQFVLPLANPCCYNRGILFCGDNDKGKCLHHFFKITDHYPEKIIFVDDKINNLLSVEKIAEFNHIDFVGIRYSGCDWRVKNFDPKKAEQQYHVLLRKINWPGKTS
jgi:hypothetical protein